MDDSNLVYIFLNSFFTDSPDRQSTKWAYDELPKYYKNTFDFNKKKV